MNNVKELQGALLNQKNLGETIVLVTIENKDLLTQTRKMLNQVGYTEAKLLYREGQYVMIVVLDKVDHMGLAQMGLAKFTKEEKKIDEAMFKPYTREVA